MAAPRNTITVNLHVEPDTRVEASAQPEMTGRGWVDFGHRSSEVTLLGTFDDLRAVLSAALQKVISAEAEARAAHYAEQAKQAEAS